MKTEYKVIGIWGDQGIHETELGTYDDLYTAETRVDTWLDDPIYKYSTFSEVRIVKNTSKIVSVARDQFVTTPDYERQGVRSVSADYEELRETVRNLEDRHVGLRHELSEDIDYVYDHITELREEVAKEIKAVRHDVTMDIMNTDSDIRALKNEVEALRREIKDLR